MPFALESNRRGFMKMLAASPLLAQIAAHRFYEKSAAAIGLDPRGNKPKPAGTLSTSLNYSVRWGGGSRS